MAAQIFGHRGARLAAAALALAFALPFSGTCLAASGQIVVCTGPDHVTSIHKVGHSRFAKTVIARSLNKDTFTCSNGKKGSLSALLAKGKLLALMPGQIYAHYPHTPSDNSKVYFYDEVIIRLQ